MCAVSSIQTFPCGHKVTCRRCFLRTIQTAIGQRSLALRCVICRTQILSLRDSVDHHDTGYKNRRKEPESRSTFARRLFYVGDCNGVTGYDAPLDGTRGTSRMPHQPANVEFTQPPPNKGDRKSDPTKYSTLRNKHQEESLVCRYSRLIMRSAKQYTVWYLENVHNHHREYVSIILLHAYSLPCYVIQDGQSTRLFESPPTGPTLWEKRWKTRDSSCELTNFELADVMMERYSTSLFPPTRFLWSERAGGEDANI